MDVKGEKSKRNRAVNFTPSEMSLLMNTVAKRACIVENKKTDAVTNKEKDVAWNEITHEFNTMGATEVRTCKNLRTKYEAMKRLTKRKAAMNKQQYLTSEGVPVLIPYNDWEYKLLSICSNIDDIDATFDGDALDTQIDFECIVVEDTKIDYQPTGSSASSDAELLPSPATCEDEVILKRANKIRSVSCTSSNADFSVSCDTEAMVDTFDNIRTVPCTAQTIPGGGHAIVEMSEKRHSGLPQRKHWDPQANRYKKTSKFDDLALARLKLVNRQIKTAEKELEFKQTEHELKLKFMHKEQTNDHSLKSKGGTLQPDKATVTSKLEDLATARLKLVNIQIEIAEKDLEFKRIEHELKLRFMHNDDKRKEEEHLMRINKLRGSNH